MTARIAILVGVIVALAASVAFGPVWLVAEATRLSKVSAQHQEAISAELAASQTLVVQAAVTRSSDYVSALAKEQHGMVDPTDNVTHVEVGDDEAERVTTLLRTVGEPTMLARVARLMVGEASALLVGDVGISAVR